MQSELIFCPKNRLIFLIWFSNVLYRDVSGGGTSLLILFRRPDLKSHSPLPNQDPDGVYTCSNPLGCRTDGGPRPMV